MTRVNRPTGGPTHRARTPTEAPRTRRNAARDTTDGPLAPPFTLDRGTGKQVFATDESLEITRGTNRLAVRIAGILRRTKHGLDVALGRTLQEKSGVLEMTPAARVTDLEPTATLADTIAKVNELLRARREAGEQVT